MPELETTSRGVGQAKRIVAEYLELAFPDYLVALRRIWDLDEERLPDPVAYLAKEPKALDRWPMVAITGSDRVTVRAGRSESVSVAYDATYNLNAFVWVNEGGEGDEGGWDRVIDIRDDLSAAVSTLLMDHVNLGTTDDFAVVQDSLSESYSDVTPVKGGRYVAGSRISFQLRVNEVIVRDPIGTADTVSVHTAIHPALA